MHGPSHPASPAKDLTEAKLSRNDFHVSTARVQQVCDRLSHHRIPRRFMIFQMTAAWILYDRRSLGFAVRLVLIWDSSVGVCPAPIEQFTLPLQMITKPAQARRQNHYWFPPSTLFHLFPLLIKRGTPNLEPRSHFATIWSALPSKCRLARRVRVGDIQLVNVGSCQPIDCHCTCAKLDHGAFDSKSNASPITSSERFQRLKVGPVQEVSTFAVAVQI